MNYMLGVEANARASNGIVRVKKDDGTDESYSYENRRLIKYPEKKEKIADNWRKAPQVVKRMGDMDWEPRFRKY